VTPRKLALALSLTTKGRASQELAKEVVGIHVLLTHLLFACDILRRFPEHVAPVKPTSVPWRF
jgi:hypothetical protein